MTITVGDVGRHLAFNLGGELPPALPLIDLVNQAGQYLISSHYWKWRQKVEMHLDLRGSISITGATISSTTLTVANSELDDYTRVTGDRIELTAGTSVTSDFYEIVNHSGDVLTLDSAPGNATADAVGTIDTNTVAFPSDFKRVVPGSAISDSDAIIHGLEFVSLDRLNTLRTNEVDVTSYGNFYGAIVHAGPTGSPNYEPVTPLLAIYPTPSANERDAFTGFYEAGWAEVTDDNDPLTLLDALEGPFFTLCEHWARARVESDEAGMAQRLAEFEQDVSLIAAKRVDGGRQPTYGIMRGGAGSIRRHGQHASVPSRFTVNAPS